MNIQWFNNGYERSFEYTSGSTTDTSALLNIRVVRRDIRALFQIYEWFDNGYELSFKYTSGSTGYTSTQERIRAVNTIIRAVPKFAIHQVPWALRQLERTLFQIYERLAGGYELSFEYTSGSTTDTSALLDIRVVR
ncbi:hypothetical protein [Sporosarcina cyprini]|uniref:hypothetical protein n=1 Tax=Sporosarcina cyprini TaxID=2910523 RepID=UPI001EDE6148|nr:hypothetical protein [Sporosarcina cyprini]MCG3087993.1 hypothetical protein [Sporosarcina cyprini]